MPTFSFDVSTANVLLLRKALAHHQGKLVEDVKAGDVQEYARRQLRALVQKYREMERDINNPISTDDPVT